MNARCCCPPDNLNTVADLFDEVLILNRRAVAFGPVQEVFTESNLALAYG